MDVLATVLLAVPLCVYFVLGGADLGVGMLVPYLGRRDETERQRVSAALWPLAVAHEAWLVVAAAMLGTCFPDLATDLFTGRLLLLLVPLLLGAVVRDAALWRRSAGGGPSCDVLLVAGSWAAAGCWGWLLGSLLTDTPDRPAPLGVGLLTAAAVSVLFCAHGLGFAVLRLTGVPLLRARSLTGGHPAPGRGGHSFVLTAVVMAALPVAAGGGLPVLDSAAAGPLARAAPLVLLAAVVPLVLAEARGWRAAHGAASAEPGARRAADASPPRTGPP
ncbi:cytochrome d ubiquinol oxidase subunit II [Streptomyces sp. NPDC058676]|uniref:cytochrome d ubiquinol oxidase subunit II n=1 Tax=unclassified Streptomyces TaxID=2593676 RepID=UPI0036661C56